MINITTPLTRQVAFAYFPKDDKIMPFYDDYSPRIDGLENQVLYTIEDIKSPFLNYEEQIKRDATAMLFEPYYLMDLIPSNSKFYFQPQVRTGVEYGVFYLIFIVVFLERSYQSQR